MKSKDGWFVQEFEVGTVVKIVAGNTEGIDNYHYIRHGALGEITHFDPADGTYKVAPWDPADFTDPDYGAGDDNWVKTTHFVVADIPTKPLTSLGEIEQYLNN